MRRFWLVLAGFGGGFVTAIAAYIPLFQMFLQMYPDCGPNSHDGQCGLASFLDAIYAASVAAVLWLIVAILLSRYLLQRLARSRKAAGAEN